VADPKLIIRIITDAKEAVSGVAKAKAGMTDFNSTMRGLAAPAGVALGAVVALGAGALNAASELQQSAGSVDAVFGKQADTIKKWSQTSADSVGLSASEYQNFASVVGASLKNMGVPMSQVAGNTNDLISLGADLAATYGGSTTQAVEALSSALRGEADPAEKYGLALNQTKVNAYLAEQGLDGLEGQALVTAKAQAVMALAAEQAGGAMGQFGRESDTVAGQQQRMTAKIDDAMAALGEGLLPIITPVVAALGDLAKWIQANAEWIGPLVAAVGVLAAGIIAYTVAQWAMNAAMAANPIGLIVIAVAALVAGFVALWNSNEAFRNAFINAWSAIKSFFSTVGKFIADVWNNTVAKFKQGLTQISNFFKSVFSGIRAVVDNVVNFFKRAWQVAVVIVATYVRGWLTTFRTIFNAVRSAIQAVVNFFKSAWQGAVNAVKTVMRAFQNVATAVFNAIKRPIQAVVGFFNNIVSAIQNVIGWLGRIKVPDIFGGLSRLMSGGGLNATYAVAPAAFSTQGLGVPSLRASSSGGSSTTINISGGLDSADAIARRIQQVLLQRDRRAHGVTIARSIR
jgi:phage-related protein